MSADGYPNHGIVRQPSTQTGPRDGEIQLLEAVVQQFRLSRGTSAAWRFINSIGESAMQVLPSRDEVSNLTMACPTGLHFMRLLASFECVTLRIACAHRPASASASPVDQAARSVLFPDGRAPAGRQPHLARDDLAQYRLQVLPVGCAPPTKADPPSPRRSTASKIRQHRCIWWSALPGHTATAAFPFLVPDTRPKSSPIAQAEPLKPIQPLCFSRHRQPGRASSDKAFLYRREADAGRLPRPDPQARGRAVHETPRA